MSIMIAGARSGQKHDRFASTRTDFENQIFQRRMRYALKKVAGVGTL